VTACDTIFNTLERLDNPVEYRPCDHKAHVVPQGANLPAFGRPRLKFT